MSSFRDAITLGRVPIESARTLCEQLGLVPPLSMSVLIHALLHPEEQEKVITASAGPSTVTGSCEIRLRRNGNVIYNGHIHESGAISHRYMFITVLNVFLKDESPPSTEVILIAHGGHINGTLAFGSRDDDWNEDTIDPFVAKHWLVIDPQNARTDISVSTGDIDVVEAALGLGLITAGAAANPFLLLQF